MNKRERRESKYRECRVQKSEAENIKERRAEKDATEQS